MEAAGETGGGVKKGRIRIGVSACLIGNPVRYDGLDQHDHFVTGVLGRFFELVPVCPEQECGLGVPRDAMRLVGEAERPRLLVICSGADKTEQMLSWCRQKIPALDQAGINGFILKSKSPSCGTERVKVFPRHQGGEAERSGTGLFARAIRDRFPLLPVTDEQKLSDLKLRDAFIEQVFFWARWQMAHKQAMSAQGLIDFHSTNKLQVLAHSAPHYRTLGRVAAQGKDRPLAERFAEYEAVVMEALAVAASPAKHANVMEHILGYFKHHLTATEKQRVLAAIEQCRQGHAPLIVPLTLLAHYSSLHRQNYLERQHYLNPHPDELMLRYHA